MNMLRALAFAPLLGTAVLISADQPTWPKRVDRGFYPGEVLKFNIRYEFISAGIATMEIKDGPVLYGRPTLLLETRAESNSVIDKVFKVRDYNASTVDEASLTTLGFHQNLREGGYKVTRTTTIDYTSGTYTFVRERKGTVTKRSGSINQHVQDILSSFFYARTLPLELGKEYTLTVFSDEELYPLLIKVHNKIHKVNTPAGKFDCIRIEPKITGDAIFKASEGRMTLWLTNDHRRIPVLIRSKVGVGAFDAELLEFRDGQAPQASRLP